MHFSIISLLLPAMTWMACVHLTRNGRSSQPNSRPSLPFNLLIASILWVAIAHTIVEILSAAHALTAPNLRISWALAAATLTTLACVQPPSLIGSLRRLPAHLPSWKHTWRHGFSIPQRLQLTLVIGLALLQAFLGFLATPDSTDALAFQLPAVTHALQNQSLAPFPTHDLRQVEHAPLTTSLQLTTVALTDSDRFAQLPNALALALLALASALLANEVTLRLQPNTTPSQRRQVNCLASLAAVSIPIALTNAASTHPELHLATWITSAWALLWRWHRDPRDQTTLIGLSLSIALAWHSTQLALFLVPPVILTFTGVVLSQAWNSRSLRPILPPLLALSLTLTLIPLPHIIRLRNALHSTWGSTEERARLGHDNHSPAITASTLLRHASLHTQTGIESTTSRLHSVLQLLHDQTRLPLDDLRTTLIGKPFTWNEATRYNVEQGSAFWHLAFLLIGGTCSIPLFLRATNDTRTLALAQCLLLTSGGILYAAFLRWSPEAGRQHLPWIACLLPITMAAWTTRPLQPIHTPVSLLLASVALTVVITNESRPLADGRYWRLPRELALLRSHGAATIVGTQNLTSDILAANATRIGVQLDPGDPEYALWQMLRSRGFTGTIHHTQVHNASAGLEDPHLPAGSHPDILISTWPGTLPTRTHPHTLPYGPFTALFTAKHSRWLNLEAFDHEAGDTRRLTPDLPYALLNHRVLNLYARKPRPGSLILKGRLLSTTGQPLVPSPSSFNELIIRPEFGTTLTNRLTLTHSQFEAQLPLPAGEHRITFLLTFPIQDPEGRALCHLQEWRWEPSPAQPDEAAPTSTDRPSRADR